MIKPMFTQRSAAMAVLALASTVIAGCAHIPDAEFFYKPTKWEAVVSAYVTIACSSATDLDPTILTSAKMAPVYSADDAKGRQTIALRDLNAFYADVDLGIEWFEDGRLKSINASSAGQGPAILSSLIGVATVFQANAAVSSAVAPLVAATEARPKTLCGELPALLPKEAKSLALTLTYRLGLNKGSVAKTAVSVPLDPAEESRVAHRALVGIAGFPVIDVEMTLSEPVPQVALPQRLFEAARPGEPAGYVRLPIQETGVLQVLAHARRSDEAAKERKLFETMRIFVPLDTTLALAIPVPALFGKSGFSLALAESGRIGKIGYSKGSGAAGAIGAVESLAGAELKGTAAKVAALKAEADYIAAQTRLAKCRKSADDC